jgi:hypothetical protein
VLRERFEFAASAGRYIDLSNQSEENQHVSKRDTDGAFKVKQGEESRLGVVSGSGNLLSASDATEEFNRLPIPVLPNTIARAETPHLRPELCAIKTAIQNVLLKLKAARDELIGAMATGSQVKLCGCVFVCVCFVMFVHKPARMHVANMLGKRLFLCVVECVCVF